MHKGSEARRRMSRLENAKKQQGCVQCDAFRGVVGTFAAGWGPARQVVNWVPLCSEGTRGPAEA